jgi:hypothetical protein
VNQPAHQVADADNRRNARAFLMKICVLLLLWPFALMCSFLYYDSSVLGGMHGQFLTAGVCCFLVIWVLSGHCLRTRSPAASRWTKHTLRLSRYLALLLSLFVMFSRAP